MYQALFFNIDQSSTQHLKKKKKIISIFLNFFKTEGNFFLTLTREIRNLKKK